MTLYYYSDELNWLKQFFSLQEIKINFHAALLIRGNIIHETCAFAK